MKTLDQQFEYSHVKHPRQICGIMIPFRPHFWVQHLPSGKQEIFNTRQEVFQWIKDWYEICNNKKPYWLTRKIKK